GALGSMSWPFSLSVPRLGLALACNGSLPGQKSSSPCASSCWIGAHRVARHTCCLWIDARWRSRDRQFKIVDASVAYNAIGTAHDELVVGEGCDRHRRTAACAVRQGGLGLDHPAVVDLRPATFRKAAVAIEKPRTDGSGPRVPSNPLGTPHQRLASL